MSLFYLSFTSLCFFKLILLVIATNIMLIFYCVKYFFSICLIIFITPNSQIVIKNTKILKLSHLAISFFFIILALGFIKKHRTIALMFDLTQKQPLGWLCFEEQKIFFPLLKKYFYLCCQEKSKHYGHIHRQGQHCLPRHQKLWLRW